MNSFLHSVPPRLLPVTLLLLSFAFAAPGRAFSQTLETIAAEQEQQPQPTAQPSPAEPSANAAETEAAQKRLARARSLAAIGKLAAAANELESVRASTICPSCYLRSGVSIIWN